MWKIILIATHSATRHFGDTVATLSLCAFQQRSRYVSNETPNDVLMKSSQDVSVVDLHDILSQHRDDVSRGRNNDVSSVRLHNVLN